MSYQKWITIFLLLSASLISLAASSESGPLLLQLPSAGPTISVTQLTQTKQYEKFEKQLLANIANGPKLASLIENFDYDVAKDVGNLVKTKIYKMAYSEDPQAGKVIDYLPDWAKPIYDYAEGVPESRMLGNYGQVMQPYAQVNDELRDNEPDSPATIEWVSQMRTALTHLPKFEGISFRGARLMKDKVEKYYQTGKLITDTAFISTSISSEIALRFAYPMYNLVDSEYKKINLLLVIKGQTGRPVSALADDHDDEDEILFANGTKLRVIAKSPVFKLPDVLAQNQIIVLKEELP